MKVDCKTCAKNGKCNAQVNGGTCHYMSTGKSIKKCLKMVGVYDIITI
jgi:hypothetical protein